MPEPVSRGGATAAGPRLSWWRAVPAEGWVLLATWFVVAVGAGLRIRQWSTGRPFWLDELLLLRAMSEQRFSQLLQPLRLAQSAPPGWLAVEHVMVGLSGADERWSRLVPLLFGIAGLAITVPLARLLLGGPAALAAIALVAISPPLIWYSDEFKQYSSDAFWVPLVLLVGARFALRDDRRRRVWVALGATATVVVWFSHAGTLVAAGVLAELAVLTLARRRYRELLVLVAVSVPYGVSLVIEYVTLLSRNTGNQVLQDYWADAFPPDGPLTRSVALDWLSGRAHAVADNPIGLTYGVPLLLLLLAGLLALGLRRPPAVPLLLVPVGIVTAAGLAGSYPISDRLALWLVPMVAIVLAATLTLPGSAARLRGAARIPGVVAAAVLAVAALSTVVVMVRPQVSNTTTYAERPRTQEDSRTVLAAIGADRRPGDLVLVDYRGSSPAAWFYGRRLGVGPVSALQATPKAASCINTPVGGQLREAGAHQRVWLFVVHERATDLALDRAQLATFGPLVRIVSATGARAYLYERSPTPMPDPVPKPWHCARIVTPD